MNQPMKNNEFYQQVRDNRMWMYAKPNRYYNREDQNGSAFRFLFLVEMVVFLLLMAAAGTGLAQSTIAGEKQDFAPASNMAGLNIHNYNTVYNEGKVFVSWTSKNETEDCLYIVERSGDGNQFESVGVKEGIGARIELYYSWVDKNPPAGFAYYRVKKITREGEQLYSSVSSVINQSTNFGNYALGVEDK